MAKVEVANSTTTPNAVCVFGLVKQKKIMGKNNRKNCNKLI